VAGVRGRALLPPVAQAADSALANAVSTQYLLANNEGTVVDLVGQKVNPFLNFLCRISSMLYFLGDVHTVVGVTDSVTSGRRINAGLITGAELSRCCLAQLSALSLVSRWVWVGLCCLVLFYSQLEN
jgi:hypothetical protein